MLDVFARLRRRNPQADQLAESMTGAQFQALRQLMHLTQAEVGMYLVDHPVSERAVQYWEAGKRAIPLDAARSLQLLVLERRRQIDNALEDIAADPDGRPTMVWYRTKEDWAWREQDERVWKLHNSAAAALFADGLSELVTFDVSAYQAWLADRPQYAGVPAFTLHLAWAQDVVRGDERVDPAQGSAKKSVPTNGAGN